MTTTMSSLLDSLNPQQRRAAEHQGGPLLVLAGAGSGKTRVITVRIAHMIAQGVEPEHILALTFTNKAAKEMAERVAELIGRETAKKLTIGTFHSLGLRIVEAEAGRLGLPKPITLLDAGDQAVAVRRCLKDVGLDPRRHNPQVFLGAISQARNAGITPDQMAKTSNQRFTAAVYRAYLAWLKGHQAIDFDDLLLKPVQLLKTDTEVRDRLRERFHTILVDEYQDTNQVQLELVRQLADIHRSLCVVGDDDQSIYGWRGACIDNILAFERHFPDATTIALEQNYRSTGHVLSCANAVIRKNTNRKDKKLWTASGDGPLARVVACKDPSGEASYVAAEIDRMRSEERYTPGDVGVLFRAGAQARAFEKAFRLAGIPYRVVGAYEFFKRKEIKDVLSYLRVIHNPRDRSAFVRIVNFPQRGLGPKAVEGLLDFAARENINPIEAAERATELTGLRRAQIEAYTDLAALIGGLAVRAKGDGGGDIEGIVMHLCERTGARAAWIRDPTEGPGGESRWRSVEQLVEHMRKWSQDNPDGKVADYLKQVTLDARTDEGEEEGKEAVALMTIHSAKGLEWPVCFVVGCQEGLLPHQRTLDEGADLSEERRLFYVAMTRAREVLYLTRARRRKTFRGTEPARPSRFLADLPDASIENVDRTTGSVELEKTETKARFADLLDRLGKS
jgi:DNA helicase-2/ATP-dependent DNA helicase PcrA